MFCNVKYVFGRILSYFYLFSQDKMFYTVVNLSICASKNYKKTNINFRCPRKTVFLYGGGGGVGAVRTLRTCSQLIVFFDALPKYIVDYRQIGVVCAFYGQKKRTGNLLHPLG